MRYIVLQCIEHLLSLYRENEFVGNFNVTHHVKILKCSEKLYDYGYNFHLAVFYRK